jgi:hypothetical protein
MSNITDYTDQLTAIMESAGYNKNYLQLNVLAHWAELKDTLITQLPALFTDDKVAAIEEYRQGLYLGGVDMTAIPTWKGGVIVLIPIFALITSMISTVISTLIQKKNNPAQAKQMGSMLMMMLMMPSSPSTLHSRCLRQLVFTGLFQTLLPFSSNYLLQNSIPPERARQS